MSGAIIGDIVGSRFEFNPTNDYNFELFSPQCSFTGQEHTWSKNKSCAANRCLLYSVYVRTSMCAFLCSVRGSLASRLLFSSFRCPVRCFLFCIRCISPYNLISQIARIIDQFADGIFHKIPLGYNYYTNRVVITWNIFPEYILEYYSCKISHKN